MIPILIMLLIATIIIGFKVSNMALDFGFDKGKEAGKSELMDQAVKAGHAEYYLDSENNRQWRWKQ